MKSVGTPEKCQGLQLGHALALRRERVNHCHAAGICSISLTLLVLASLKALGEWLKGYPIVRVACSLLIAVSSSADAAFEKSGVDITVDARHDLIGKLRKWLDV
jgi:hypothetical protein